MEKITVVIGTVALLLVCAGCGNGIDANGIPLDRAPAGFHAKECYFEDVQASPTDQQRWQRMVCRHLAS